MPNTAPLSPRAEEEQPLLPQARGESSQVRMEGGEPKIMYVDDITNEVTGDGITSVLQKVEDGAEQTDKWLRDNSMVLPMEKTKLLICCTKELRRAREVPQSCQITVNHHTLDSTPREKLLGLTISDDLCWETYMWGKPGGTRTFYQVLSHS